MMIQCNVTTSSDDRRDTKPIRIRVDAGKRQPLRLRFGFNTNHAKIRQPFDHPAFIDAVSESGTSIMRFPAGTLGNFYDWRSDRFLIAPLEHPATRMVPRAAFADDETYEAALVQYDVFRKRIRQVLKSCNEDTRPVYGFDSFLNMVQQSGSELLLMGNMSTAPEGIDPVDHLVDWIQQLQSQSITVRYLELGNEVYHKNQKWFNGFHDPVRYLREAERAARRIKSIMPDIQIGIVGSFTGARTGAELAERERYNQALLAYPRHDFYDAVTMHSYLGLSERSRRELKQVQHDVLAKTAKVAADSARSWQMRFPDKEIWMTETGSWTRPSDQSVLVTGMLNAVMEADYLLQYALYDEQITMYLKHKALEPVLNSFSTMFLRSSEPGAELVKSPVYYAYHLVAGAMKRSSCRVALSLSDNPVVHVLNQAENLNDEGGAQPEEVGNEVLSGDAESTAVEAVTARAFMTEDETELYITFVNKTGQRQPVMLELADVPFVQPAITMQSVSGALTDRNTVQEPDRVSLKHRPCSDRIMLPPYAVGRLTVMEGAGGAEDGSQAFK